MTKMRMSLYDVTISYADNIPVFNDRVSAKDEEHAKRIANYDAVAKGWPQTYTHITAKQLKD